MVSLILATLLYANFGFRSGTSPVIYIVGAFLLAMCGWQFSTFVIGLKLKKNFSNRRVDVEMENRQITENQYESAKTRELLNEADFTDVVPISVTEKTTRQFSKKIGNRSTHSEH